MDNLFDFVQQRKIEKLKETQSVIQNDMTDLNSRFSSHTHTANDVGAAETNHTHDEADFLKKYIVVLTVSGWNDMSQSISVNGVTSNSTLLIGADVDSIDEYSSAKVKCTTQSTNQLTFSCESVPKTDLYAIVIVMGV